MTPMLTTLHDIAVNSRTKEGLGFVKGYATRTYNSEKLVKKTNFDENQLNGEFFDGFIIKEIGKNNFFSFSLSQSGF